MSVKRLIAANMNEGLKRIREALGPDAMILKTVKRNGKIEFFVEADVALEQDPEAPLVDEQGLAEESAQDTAQVNPELQEAFLKARMKMLSSLGEEPATSPVPVMASSAGHDAFDSLLSNARQEQRRSVDRTVNSLLDELQLAPALAAKLRGLRRIDELIDHLSLMISTTTAPLKGMFAFVGPSGSGKTTSLVKLVTRQVMQHGPGSCAIVNCDRFRAGAKQQLTRLGELLDVDVVHVSPELSLNQAIAKVAHRDFVAIDTAGLGMQDPQLQAEMFKLSGSNYDLRRFLVLPTNLQLSAMELAARVYGGNQVRDVILTRLDEAPYLGTALSFLAQSGLNLAYTCHGAQIEDISAARGPELVQLAVTRLDEPFAQLAMSDFTYRVKEQSTEPQGVVTNMVADL